MCVFLRLLRDKIKNTHITPICSKSVFQDVILRSHSIGVHLAVFVFIDSIWLLFANYLQQQFRHILFTQNFLKTIFVYFCKVLYARQVSQPILGVLNVWCGFNLFEHLEKRFCRSEALLNFPLCQATLRQSSSTLLTQYHEILLPAGQQK